MMNKLKIVGLTLAMCFGLTALNAQDTKVNTGIEKASKTKAEAQSDAKSTAAEIGEALGIKKRARLGEIAQIVNNYELALVKLNNGNIDADKIDQVKEGLAADRDKRLSGLFSSSEMKMYTMYKEQKASQEAAVEEGSEATKGAKVKANQKISK